VLQNVDEQLIGPTVFEDVAFAPLNFGLSREETYQRVDDTLRALGIYDLRDRLPHYLSGGERKKVALAGALVFDPELLVMDEPLEAVDQASRQEIVEFLDSLHERTGLTIILTAHDMEVVADLADSGYVMAQSGKLEISGSIQELFFDHDLSQYNLRPPAVVRMIKALQEAGMDLEPTLSLADLTRQLRAAHAPLP